jgi:hypothetical protein
MHAEISLEKDSVAVDVEVVAWCPRESGLGARAAAVRKC